LSPRDYAVVTSVKSREGSFSELPLPLEVRQSIKFSNRRMFSGFLVSNSSVDHSKRSSRAVGLWLAILFMALSAAIGISVSIVNLRIPFPVPGQLMWAADFTTPNGLLKYALRLFFIFLFNVPLLYGGIATAFDFTNAATSITLAFASVLFGIASWGLYRFKNWARLFTVAISVFTFLPMLGNLPPFYVDSFTATTAFMPFVVPYGLMFFYFRREDVRQAFA
jgi:hypothetical protein